MLKIARNTSKKPFLLYWLENWVICVLHYCGLIYIA